MTTNRYAIACPPEWTVPGGQAETIFTWNYDDGRDRLLALYEKGKDKQWNATHRIDWSIETNPDNPIGTPDAYVPIFGSPLWEKLGGKERIEIKRHLASWQFSQFLHGEQGALVCSAKIVQAVPQIDSKFYAATQVVDEARHVEVYARFLREKIGFAYPVNKHLGTLLQSVVQDHRWDMTTLGMQIIIEGLALAAFQIVRDMAEDPLARSLTAFVMQDEARHVAFGRLALRDFYPQLTEKERDEREDFVVEACYLMRDRFLGEEVWDNLGYDSKECLQFVEQSISMQEFRKALFSRIVPTIKDIGLWGPKVRKAFDAMGVLAYSDLDVVALGEADEVAGDAFDAARAASRADHVNKVVAFGEAE